MNRFSLESPSAMRMVHCESTIWGAKEALYYRSLVSHSANDASLVMPIKSYCYELNLYDLSAEKQVCQLRQNGRLNSIYFQASFSPPQCLPSPRSPQRIFPSHYTESSTCHMRWMRTRSIKTYIVASGIALPTAEYIVLSHTSPVWMECSSGKKNLMQSPLEVFVSAPTPQPATN
jgi:hypothetical protein